LRSLVQENLQSFLSVDDEPDDGPEHYVMICGFHQPHLLSHLADLNVSVDSIIRLKSEDYARFHPNPEDEDLELEKDEKTLCMFLVLWFF
jgi:hypothetical protein